MISQENLFLAMAGAAIFTVGVLSLCGHFTSVLSRERILLWFGLFAGPYGIALICHSVLVTAWGGKAEAILLLVGRLIGLLASIPALLLFREFYGSGWRLSTKWLIWIYVLSVLGSAVFMMVHEHARSIPSPGITLVILVPLELALDRLAGYRPPPLKERPVIFVGLFLFFLTYACDRLSHWETGHDHIFLEPFGFLILTFCLGYVVSRRVASNESEWMSMSHEMRAASKIQAAILPATMPKLTGYSIAARYAPMTAVAGDFYSFPERGPACLGVIVADVMGHGVPAALIASMIKVSVFSGVDKHERPGAIIGELNMMLCREAPSQLATAVYVSLDRSRGIGQYCAAGHPAPLLWRHSIQKLVPLADPGLLLGVRAEESFTDTEFHFEAGDRLLLYTDGLTEAETPAGQSYGDAQLPAFFAEHQGAPSEQFASRLLEEVLHWSANGSELQQADDITFVVVDLI